MGFGKGWQQYIENNPDRVAADTGARDTPQKEQYRKKRWQAREEARKERVALMCRLCGQRGLPEPTDEYVFHPERKWRLDYAWTEPKVAIEVQGGIWTRGRHVRGKGYKNDMEKLNEAQLCGWIVLQVEPDELFKPSTFELIERAIDEQRS